MPDLLQILCAYCNGKPTLVTWRYLFYEKAITRHDARTDAQTRTGSTLPCTGFATSPYYLGAVPGAQKQKSVQIAIFLRLRIIARCQNADRSSKTQQKRHISGLEKQRSVRNRKKVAKMPSFLFLQWARSPQRGRSHENAQDIMAGKLNSETRKAPAMRTPPEKPILLESTLPWHRTARNKHRARLSAYRRSLLRPVPHGCTEAR